MSIQAIGTASRKVRRHDLNGELKAASSSDWGDDDRSCRQRAQSEPAGLPFGATTSARSNRYDRYISETAVGHQTPAEPSRAGLHASLLDRLHAEPGRCACGTAGASGDGANSRRDGCRDGRRRQRLDRFDTRGPGLCGRPAADAAGGGHRAAARPSAGEKPRPGSSPRGHRRVHRRRLPAGARLLDCRRQPLPGSRRPPGGRGAGPAA